MRNLSYENEFCTQFHFHANQSHFHKNGFALRLALKQRHKGTRKWSIKKLVLMQHKRVELAKPVDTCCGLPCCQWTGDDTFLRVRADAKFTADI